MYVHNVPSLLSSIWWWCSMCKLVCSILVTSYHPCTSTGSPRFLLYTSTSHRVRNKQTNKQIHTYIYVSYLPENQLRKRNCNRAQFVYPLSNQILPVACNALLDDADHVAYHMVPIIHQLQLVRPIFNPSSSPIAPPSLLPISLASTLLHRHNPSPWL
jgi:hypothetical protein